MCFVCGTDNPIGLHLSFYQEDDRIWTEFTPGEEHQGYPGTLHGGLVCTLLDETMGRVAALRSLWMMTAKIEVTYRKVVPLSQPLRITASIVDFRGSRMVAQGTITLPDGSVAVEAKGLFVRIPEERRQGFIAGLRAQGMEIE